MSNKRRRHDVKQARPNHPVPSRRALVLVWLGAAVLFGGLLVAAQASRGPLDDADPARQRPGFLDAGPLPEPASPVTGDVPVPGRRAVVFFERPARLGRLCHALAAHDFAGEPTVAVVVGGEGGTCMGPDLVVDDAMAIAERYGMREPQGGGAPVGYAVVDGDGLIRYRTLDPTVHDELTEIDTILEAL